MGKIFDDISRAVSNVRFAVDQLRIQADANKLERLTPQITVMLRAMISEKINPTSLDDFSILLNSTEDFNFLFQQIKADPGYKTIVSKGLDDQQIRNLLHSTITLMSNERFSQILDELSTQIVKEAEQVLLLRILDGLSEHVSEELLPTPEDVSGFLAELATDVEKKMYEAAMEKVGSMASQLAPTGKILEGNTMTILGKDVNMKRKKAEIVRFIESLPQEFATGRITTATQLADRLTKWCHAHVRK